MTTSSKRIAGIAALCLVSAVACAKHHDDGSPSVGTNTNWLKPCSASSDCSGSGACSCGVCTRACTDSTDCSTLGAGVSCAKVGESMCGAGASGSVCLSECRGDDDCAMLADGSCRAGHCVAVGQSNVDGGQVDAGRSLTRTGAEVQIPGSYRSCTTHADCMLVETGCDGCCERDAIRKSEEQTYHMAFDQACSDYRGPICDCTVLPLTPRCEDGLCTAAAFDPQRDCYSPTQNFDRAYEPDAVGCACDQLDLQICVGGAALVCRDDAAKKRTWAAVEDGPCALTVSGCETDAQRPDATACLADFETCVERPSPGGSFCGKGCYRPLDCNPMSCQPGGDCTSLRCQYAPIDAMGCMDGKTHFEGLCGSIRYRVDSGGTSAGTWYWDDATGALLAMQTSGDLITTCSTLEYGDFSVIHTCQVVTDDTTRLCLSE